MKPFEDTLKCNAHYYLDDSGHTLTREEFLKELILAAQYGQHGYMIYLGSGFVPLEIAVIARNVEDAYDILEEWCRDTDRLDEIKESPDVDADEYGAYESTWQTIPLPVVITQYELDELREAKCKD